MKILSWLLISVAVVLAFSSSASAVNPIVCSFCEFGVKFVDGFVQLNYNQTQIIGIAETLCAAATPEIKRDCDYAFQTYLPIVIKDLLSGMSALAICAQGGMCDPPAGGDVEVEETQPLSGIRYN
jgi:hypothetical protein